MLIEFLEETHGRRLKLGRTIGDAYLLVSMTRMDKCEVAHVAFLGYR